MGLWLRLLLLELGERQVLLLLVVVGLWGGKG